MLEAVEGRLHRPRLKHPETPNSVHPTLVTKNGSVLRVWWVWGVGVTLFHEWWKTERPPVPPTPASPQGGASLSPLSSLVPPPHNSYKNVF